MNYRSVCPFQDFDGQARAENLSRIIVVLFGVVGLIWGYIIQHFSQTVYILGAGLVLATIVS
jgi:signal peptidase complex subunit 1